jgi:hypothetical protein
MSRGEQHCEISGSQGGEYEVDFNLTTRRYISEESKLQHRKWNSGSRNIMLIRNANGYIRLDKTKTEGIREETYTQQRIDTDPYEWNGCPSEAKARVNNILRIQSVPQKKHHFSFTKFDWLMFKEMIPVYVENHTKRINTKCNDPDSSNG